MQPTRASTGALPSCALVLHEDTVITTLVAIRPIGASPIFASNCGSGLQTPPGPILLRSLKPGGVALLVSPSSGDTTSNVKGGGKASSPLKTGRRISATRTVVASGMYHPACSFFVNTIHSRLRWYPPKRRLPPPPVFMKQAALLIELQVVGLDLVRDPSK